MVSPSETTVQNIWYAKSHLFDLPRWSRCRTNSSEKIQNKKIDYGCYLENILLIIIKSKCCIHHALKKISNTISFYYIFIALRNCCQFYGPCIRPFLILTKLFWIIWYWIKFIFKIKIIIYYFGFAISHTNWFVRCFSSKIRWNFHGPVVYILLNINK